MYFKIAVFDECFVSNVNLLNIQVCRKEGLETMISKEKVRRRALEARNCLGEAWRKDFSKVIIDQVLESEMYQRAGIVLSYSAIRSEVDTDLLNRKVLEHGKKLYLPKTYFKEKKMCFYPVEDLRKLRKGYQGILEPEETVPMEDLLEEGKQEMKDILMIMPGVAFDENGHRMGYGGGYYDRYLAVYGKKLVSLLVAFDEQKALLIPAETCDVKPDYIVTQSGWICGKGGDRQ